MSTNASIGYDDLADDDRNMLVVLSWVTQQQQFLSGLEVRKNDLSTLVAHHLSLRRHQTCIVAPRSEWLRGSYNVCVPVTITNYQTRRVVIRCPLPHVNQPGPSLMTDEKVRCEGATWAWITEHYPRVPVAFLRGFGLSDGTSFTPLSQCSWFVRIYESLRRKVLQFFGIESWRPFMVHPSAAVLSTGYTIVDFIEPAQGTMLGTRMRSTDLGFRTELRHSLAGIMLDMISTPLPRIGSFVVLNSGEVALSNRPLTAPLAQLEAQGIRTSIRPWTTYTRADVYIDDLIRCHELRLMDQPNAAHSQADAEAQMATIVVLKALRSAYISSDSLPYNVLQFTDLNPSNVFVNERGEITAILDLEFSCALPIQMLRPPFWLSGHVGDDFFGEATAAVEAEYDSTAQDFFGTLGQKDWMGSGYDARLAMQGAFHCKSHWFFEAVNHPNQAYSFLIWHLQPRLAPEHLGPGSKRFREALLPYYNADAKNFVQQRILANSNYHAKLRSMAI